MKHTIQKVVQAALLAALVCVATMAIRIPSPLGGYINLGDGAVLLCARFLPLPFGFLAAAVGSALADLLSGYAVYAPATFLIKGLMVVAFALIQKAFAKKNHPAADCVIGGVVAELVMSAGYLFFESFLYGFGASLVNLSANAVQGVAGVAVGLALIRLFEKAGIFQRP